MIENEQINNDIEMKHYHVEQNGGTATTTTTINHIKNSTNTANGHKAVSKNKNKEKTKNSTNFIDTLFELIKIKEENATKEIGTLILLGTMLLLFIISVVGFIVMWFTEYYNNKLLENLILAKNSEAAKSWMNPDPKYDTLLKVHIFNYTNINEYMAGRAKKIKVRDVGPFVYQEHTIKEHVSFNDNYTVTYRDFRSYKFLPELSVYNESIKLMVPNMPLLSAAEKVKAFEGLRGVVSTLAVGKRQPAFKMLTTKDFLWGYPDDIVQLSDIGTGKDKFGVLMNRNGSSVDMLQIYTGEDDIRKFSVVAQFNGKPEMNFWSQELCNQVNGSEPSMFPPHLLKERERIYVFLQVLCRKVPLVFEKPVLLFKDIEALRYHTADDVFANPTENPNNQCYCENTARCLPSGVINATKCYDGAPIYPSFPHFYGGDPELYADFEGIQPQRELHQTFADIHPRFAFPIGGASRIQLNIAISTGAVLNKKIYRLPHGFILPVFWIEITSGEFTQDILDKLFMSTYGLDVIQATLQYGTLLICLVSFILIVAVINNLSRRREQQYATQKQIVES